MAILVAVRSFRGLSGDLLWAETFMNAALALKVAHTTNIITITAEALVVDIIMEVGLVADTTTVEEALVVVITS